MSLTPKEAEELFQRGRKASRDLELIRAHRDQLLSGTPSGGIPTATTGGGVSDPTGRAGGYLADMSATWAEEERTLLGQIQECRDLCHGVALAFRDPEYQIVLESYYLLGMEWKQVAKKMDRGVTKVLNMRRAALDYVAYVGPAAAKQGHGRAEE